MPNWWVVYSDRTILSSDDCDVYDLPGRDVQAVVSPCPEHGWEVWRRWNTDFYVWMPERGQWRGCDQFGLYDYLCEPGQKKVLFGRTMFNEEYNELMRWLENHPDLPLKSGWRPGERS